MHPADELARLRAEISALRQREADLGARPVSSGGGAARGFSGPEVAVWESRDAEGGRVADLARRGGGWADI